MRLRRPAIGLAVSASLVLGGAAAPAVQAQPADVSVKVGQADAFSRIEFDGAQPHAVRREGSDLVLDFGAAGAPNLSLLRVDPPRYLKTASAARTAQGLQLRLTLAEGVEAKVGRADGGTYVNLYPGAMTPAPDDQTPVRGGDPVPVSGVVKMHATPDGGALALSFDWRGPVGAAVFRRGPAIWVVFDAKAMLDLSEAPSGSALATSVELVPTRDAAAFRILAPDDVQASAVAEGSRWTITLVRGGLGKASATSPQPVAVKPDPDTAGLDADVAGATGVFWIDDPSVGDRLAVVTARGPAKGLAAPRRLVDADLLASVQGLALAPRAADLTVKSDGDVVRIARPNGMQISAAGAAGRLAPPPPSLPQPTSMPALVDFAGWSAPGAHGFYTRYQALQQGAADEAAKGKDAPTVARFGFARFLVGSELAFEAIGELDLLAKQSPAVLNTSAFRGLRGAARAMAGRYRDAQADFSSPTVADDPASAVWRGYAAAKLGDSSGAKIGFAAGQAALVRFAPVWQVRFRLAQADAALAAGDLASAKTALQAVQSLNPKGVEADRFNLAEGRLFQAAGHPDQALPLYQQAMTSAYGGVSAPALLYATEVQEGQGKISDPDAAQALQSVSYRWRGDAAEIEAARALGRLYIGQGEYRQGLEALRTAAGASPNLPGAAGVQADLGDAFRNLFLNGAADGLQPVQALSLFFDFKDLTPIGADGDLMVRRLARRLVDVDLLDQAAELLKYQADNRLDGVARAQVDTDLATVQLMNRQPEAAIDALNASRTTLLPSALQSSRRVIEARALTALGRYDDASEILDTDTSPDAQAARAEIAWRKHDWPLAGKLAEVALGARFKSPAPLSLLESADLLRAAIAYSLAGDQSGLARLRVRYGKLADGASDPNILKVALAGAQGVDGGAESSHALADADGFTGWIQAMKAKLLTSGLSKT